MKKITFLIFVFTINFVSSQSRGVNFQSILFNSTGDIEVNQTVPLRFSIISQTDSILYSEEQNVTTDSRGMVNVVIGKGINNDGKQLELIDWTQAKSLKVFRLINGSYILLGSSGLEHVPFSFSSMSVNSPGIQISSGIVSATQFIGDGSGLTNINISIKSSENGNTSAGSSALEENTTGHSNTAFGNKALKFNTEGEGNSAFGDMALSQNTTGRINSAFGDVALIRNTTGSANTAIGFGSLYFNNTGIDNTALGTEALYNSIDANENVAVLAEPVVFLINATSPKAELIRPVVF